MMLKITALVLVGTCSKYSKFKYIINIYRLSRSIQKLHFGSWSVESSPGATSDDAAGFSHQRGGNHGWGSQHRLTLHHGKVNRGVSFS